MQGKLRERPFLHLMPWFCKDILDCLDFIDRQPWGDSSARLRDIDAAMEAVIRWPTLGNGIQKKYAVPSEGRRVLSQANRPAGSGRGANQLSVPSGPPRNDSGPHAEPSGRQPSGSRDALAASDRRSRRAHGHDRPSTRVPRRNPRVGAGLRRRVARVGRSRYRSKGRLGPGKPRLGAPVAPTSVCA